MLHVNRCEKHATEDNIARDYGGAMIVKSGPQMCFFQVADCPKISRENTRVEILQPMQAQGDLDKCLL